MTQELGYNRNVSQEMNAIAIYKVVCSNAGGNRPMSFKHV